MSPLQQYRLTALRIDLEHVDVSTFEKEDDLLGRQGGAAVIMFTGRVSLTAHRGGDSVSITRRGTPDEVIALAAKALDVLA